MINIALVHDHLMQVGGAERVLRIFNELYPDAPIYTLVYDKKKIGSLLPPDVIRPSFLQTIPFGKKKYQWLLPIMPTATESYNLEEYDIVLSSASAFAKGIITKSTTLHICYCHTPTRYLWTDTHQYIRELNVPYPIKKVLPFMLTRLRMWDTLAAGRVDKFIANSQTVRERISKFYRRESDIIYPPVALDSFTVSKTCDDYYLAGGRLVSYKRFDIPIMAFNRLGIPLKIFGDGPEYRNLRKIARKNIEFVGAADDATRCELYSKCIAFINPQEEDFGITTLEAAASGRPVIAYAAGGALETVVDGVTGVFFYDQDYAALIDAVLHFDPSRFDPETLRIYSLRYGVDRFKKEITDYIDKQWTQWQEVQEMKRIRETKMMF
ncbi:glycosyltransferase [Candidatus Uhrbacteria bacterium]|nr:glycosyltransferase [Candidatus Uhrbacteria bacterium]